MKNIILRFIKLSAFVALMLILSQHTRYCTNFYDIVTSADFTLPSPSSSSSSSLMSHSLGSSDSRPSVIGHSDMRQGGDGQDGDSSQNSRQVMSSNIDTHFAFIPWKLFYYM